MPRTRPRKLPPRLCRVVADAGYVSLQAWAEAAGVSAKGLYWRRYHGSPPGRKVTAAMLAVSAKPLLPEVFHAALLEKPEAQS